MIAGAFVGLSRLISAPSVDWRCDPSSGAQRIYFANHSSHLDFVVIWASLPAGLRRVTRPVAGRDYWEQGVVRPYVARDVFHAVLIDRSNGHTSAHRSAHAALARMADALGDRHSLIVFPEGTRSANGEVGSFKSGLFHLARMRLDVELIPVHVENLHRVLPKGEALPVPMLSRVVFGPRMSAAPDAGKQAFLQTAREAILDLRRAA